MEEFAMKLEKSGTNQVIFEAKLYNYLNLEKGDKGVPRVYAYGTDADYNYMVMDLLGSSLEELFEKF
jgi:casein kinase 1